MSFNRMNKHINVSDPATQNRIFWAGVSIVLHPVPPEPERESGRQILIQDSDQMLSHQGKRVLYTSVGVFSLTTRKASSVSIKLGHSVPILWQQNPPAFRPAYIIRYNNTSPETEWRRGA